MLQGSIYPLAEAVVTDRPRRQRDTEPSEIARRERYEAGLCRGCNRKRTKGAFCTQHHNEVERNTARDPGKQARKGRLTIGDCDGADAKLAMRAFCAGFAGLDEVAARPDFNRNERRRFEAEPLSQLLLGVRSAFAIAKRRGMVDDWLDAIEQSLTKEE